MSYKTEAVQIMLRKAKDTVVFELKDVADIYVEVDSFVSTMVKIIEKEGIN